MKMMTFYTFYIHSFMSSDEMRQDSYGEYDSHIFQMHDRSRLLHSQDPRLFIASERSSFSSCFRLCNACPTPQLNALREALRRLMTSMQHIAAADFRVEFFQLFSSFGRGENDVNTQWRIKQIAFNCSRYHRGAACCVCAWVWNSRLT